MLHPSPCERKRKVNCIYQYSLVSLATVFASLVVMVTTLAVMVTTLLWGLTVGERRLLLYLENRSFSSCSEQNGPKFATKRVVQGPLLLLLLFTKAAEVDWFVVAVVVVEPTGLPSMGLAAAMWG